MLSDLTCPGVACSIDKSGVAVAIKRSGIRHAFGASVPASSPATNESPPRIARPKSIKGEMSCPDEPVWVHLAQLVGVEVAGDFMWMFQVELLGDLGIARAGGDQAQDLELARGEEFEISLARDVVIAGVLAAPRRGVGARLRCRQRLGGAGRIARGAELLGAVEERRPRARVGEDVSAALRRG